MSELTLEAFGYRDNEARVTRRMHALLHEQIVAKPLPSWLRRKAPWSGSAFDGVHPTPGISNHPARMCAAWRPLGDPRAMPADAEMESPA